MSCLMGIQGHCMTFPSSSMQCRQRVSQSGVVVFRSCYPVQARSSPFGVIRPTFAAVSAQPSGLSSRLRHSPAQRSGNSAAPPCSLPESAVTAQQQIFELSEGLEAPIQLIYLLTLLGFLVVGAYLIVRQVLIRQELEESAKVLGERIRNNQENSQDCFELGVILLRKKLYTQATRNLEKAKKGWQGDPEELAQIHNALGFAYFNMQRFEKAIEEYKQAIEKQPGYVTALNNLGDAYEKAKQEKAALDTYKEALAYAPDNKVASARVQALSARF